METEEFLSGVKLFEYLDKPSLSHLAAKLRPISFPIGPIVKKGDPGDAMYIIRSGLASVTTTGGPNATEAVLAILKTGDSFGEVSLIDGKPRTADVSATGPVECYMLLREDFLAALNEHSEIAKGILPCLAAMVRSADEWIDSLFDRLASRPSV